jgi:hypothetical protein
MSAVEAIAWALWIFMGGPVVVGLGMGVIMVAIARLLGGSGGTGQPDI